MKGIVIGLGMIALLHPAWAHHSQAEFDTSMVHDLEGEIVSIHWANPHVEIGLSITGADGTEELWELESQDINSLGRRGVSRDFVAVGQIVRAAGFVSTRQDHVMSTTNMLLPSGTEIRLRGNTQPRWTEEGVGFTNWVNNQPTVVNDDSGLFRVWTKTETNPLRFNGEPPLTAAAFVSQAAYDPLEDDPIAGCRAAGMPRAITSSGPHPLEFSERGDSIILRLETFDNVRVIHMGPNASADGEPATPLGYSTGRWEGNTLVVETTRIDWPYIDVAGLVTVQQSDGLHLEERFTLSEDDSELVYDITLTDAATFTEPVTANRYMVWRWQPGVEIQPFDCEA